MRIKIDVEIEQNAKIWWTIKLHSYDETTRFIKNCVTNIQNTLL